MKLYGQIDTTAKTPKVVRNPGILPAIYKDKTKTILNFHKCYGCTLKRMGFVEADMKEPEPIAYNDKTQELVCEWVCQDKAFELRYRAVDKQE